MHAFHCFVVYFANHKLVRGLFIKPYTQIFEAFNHVESKLPIYKTYSCWLFPPFRVENEDLCLFLIYYKAFICTEFLENGEYAWYDC